MSGRNARKADRAGGGSPGLHGAQRRKVGETGPGTRASGAGVALRAGPEGASHFAGNEPPGGRHC